MNELARVAWARFVDLGADALHLHFKSGGKRSGVFSKLLEPIWFQATHAVLKVLDICREDECLCDFGKLPSPVDKNMWLHKSELGELSSYQFMLSVAEALGSRRQQIIQTETNKAPLLN